MDNATATAREIGVQPTAQWYGAMRKAGIADDDIQRLIRDRVVKYTTAGPGELVGLTDLVRLLEEARNGKRRGRHKV